VRPAKIPKVYTLKPLVLTEAQAGIIPAKLLCAAAIVSMCLSGDIAIGGYAPSFTKKLDMSRILLRFSQSHLKGFQGRGFCFLAKVSCFRTSTVHSKQEIV